MWFFRRIESVTPQGPYTAAPRLPELDLDKLDLDKPHTDRPTSWHKSFNFLRLLPELRDLVYREAIASGNTSILRTSRFVQQEALPFVHKAGIFRIRARCSHGESYYIMTPPADLLPSPNSIQNIEIFVRIEADYGPVVPYEVSKYPDMRSITAFTDAAATVQRDTCYITFEKEVRMMHDKRPRVLLEMIKELRGFKTIIVTAIACDRAGDVGAYRAITRARMKPVYEMALEELEPVFGPGIWHDAAVQENRYLEFRPKQG